LFGKMTTVDTVDLGSRPAWGGKGQRWQWQRAPVQRSFLHVARQFAPDIQFFRIPASWH
jgi:hypothetical protein